MTTSECHVLWICQANRANLLCGNVWHRWLEAHCMMLCGKVLHSWLEARCMRECIDCSIMSNYFTRRWQRRWPSDLVCSPPLKLRVLGSPVLKWNFHECSKCKCCFLFWHLRILRHYFGEVHKLEIIKWPLGNVIIKLLHCIPWSITHANQNNRERILTSCNYSIYGFLFLWTQSTWPCNKFRVPWNLSISNNYKDVILPIASHHNVNWCINDWRKWCWTWILQSRYLILMIVSCLQNWIKVVLRITASLGSTSHQ